MSVIRRAVVVTIALLATNASAQQQTTCTDPDVHPEQCTVRQAYDLYYASALKAAGLDAVDNKVTNSNRATTAPDAFAGRVHNSYQDFLNLFSFAINKVEESANGQAITVRLNPLRDGSQLLGFTLTASKPGIADAVKNAIPEAGRSDVLSKLNDKLGDVDDLTFAGSYSAETADCSPDRPAINRCYGRSPSTYYDLLALSLASLFAAAPDETSPQAFQVKKAIVTAFTPQVIGTAPQSDVFGLQISAAVDPNDLRTKIRSLASLDAQQTVAERNFFTKQHLDVISSMIDNQPQAVLTSSYRSPGKYGGPKQTSITAELQYGPDNINAMRSECPIMGDACLQTAMQRRLTNGISTDKLVLTGTYTRNQDYNLADLGLDSTVAGFQPVNLKSSSELIVKGQAGRQLASTVGTENVRADLSLEGHRVENDRSRTTNRWVATATLTIPIGQNISVPVSVTYANRAEFLVNQNSKLAAHVGVSYRLPFRSMKR